MQTTSGSVPGVAGTPAASSTITIGTGGTDAYNEQLTAGTSITITNSIPNDAQSQTFIVGTGTDSVGSINPGTHYTSNIDSGSGGNTLGNLADAINAQSSLLGVYASVGASGLVITTGSYVSGNAAAGGTVVGTSTDLGGEGVAVTSNNLTAAASTKQLTLYSPSMGGVAGVGKPQITVLDSNGNATAIGDTLSGTFTRVPRVAAR